MLFSSITFIYLFMPLLIFLYFIFKNIKAKNIILLIFSLIFYAWGEPIYVFLLIYITLINFFLGKLVDSENKIVSNIFTFLAIVADIAFILYYKYIDLIIDTINIFGHKSIPRMNVALPLGISFFTFQIITYIIDIKRKKAEPQEKFSNMLLYISFFPQLIAGPIVRYNDIEDALNDRSFSSENFIRGSFRFAVGLFKKVMIANALGEIATILYNMDMSKVSVFATWIIVIMYTFQLYFDFSGYSDMAIGLSTIFGFSFPENFNYPYISTSLTEFWRRWHISLSSFFREYVYIPLGGKYRHQIFNLFIVWFLTGLWHGASYNFIIWGMFYFIFLVLEKIFIFNDKNKLNNEIKNNKIRKKIIGFIYTIFIVIIANNIFYRTDLNNLLESFKIMFFLKNNPISDPYSISLVRENFFLIIIAIFASTPIFKIILDKITHINNIEYILKTILTVVLIAVSTSELLSNSYNAFLYFRF